MDGATVYAALALLAAGETAPAKRGIDWICATARPDGGWASRPGVGESSWVTALAALLPGRILAEEPHRRAIDWLLGTRGEDTTAIYALRERLLGTIGIGRLRPSRLALDQGRGRLGGSDGGRADCAGTRAAAAASAASIAERATAGRNFLLAHMCAEGGWNHGATSAWGYDMAPYPETTGMALLALRGVRAPQMERALAAARTFLAVAFGRCAELAAVGTARAWRSCRRITGRRKASRTERFPKSR